MLRVRALLEREVLPSSQYLSEDMTLLMPLTRLGSGLFKQRSTKKYLTRNLKSSSEVCEGHVILDSYVISFESKTSSAFEWEHQSWRQRWD